MNATTVDALSQLPGLREAPADALAALAEQFTASASRDGELVCDEGSPAESLYVLTKGIVEVRKRSISGREHTVAKLEAPCLFGHVGVLSLAERTASICAKGDVELLHMSARRARVIIRTGDFSIASPFRRALIVAMCEQLSSATRAVANLAVEAGVAEDGGPDLGAAAQSEAEKALGTDVPKGEEEGDALTDDAQISLLTGLSQV